MRYVVLLILATLSYAATVADPPAPASTTLSPLPAGYWAIDAVVRLAVESKKNEEISQVRRYVMKDPRPVAVGDKVFLIGEGIRDWQADGTVAVPIDTVVAMARFANNVAYARFENSKTLDIGR